MKKIYYLEGLRGIACCIVVLSHLAVFFLPALYYGQTPIAHYPQFEVLIASSPFNIFYSGNLAVCMFFILSGYVLSYKFFIYEDKKIVFSGMLKRYFRLLLPVLAAMLILYLFIVAKLLFHEAVASYTKSELIQVVFISGLPTFADIIKQSFINTFFTGGTVYDHVLWTMRYEFYGSFLVFAFLLTLGLNKYRFIAYGLLTIIFWDSYYAAFVIGMFLSDITTEQGYTSKLRMHFFTKSLLFIIAIIAASYPMGVKEPVGLYSAITFTTQPLTAQIYHIAAATIILFFVLTDAKIQRLLESRIPHFLGKISFSLYLLHWIVIFSLSSFLVLVLRKINTPYPLTIALVSCISIPVMLAVSWPFYKYIDSNSMKLAKMFSHYILGKAGSGSAFARIKDRLFSAAGNQ